MAIDELAALVTVAVPAQHQINSAGFEDGHNVLAHLNQFGFRVRIVRAFGVRRMMPERDEPAVGRHGEIGAQPDRHW